MANIKDRIGRLEVRLNPQVDRRAIDEAAETFNKKFSRMLGNLKAEDAPITLEERLSTMSVAEHAAWCVGFMPEFQMNMASIEQLMGMHQKYRQRRAA